MRKKTLFGEVRKFFHGCNKQDAHDLLWNATAYPLCDLGRIREQLKEACVKGGGTVDGAIGWAGLEAEKAMDDYRERTETIGLRP